MTSTYVLPQIVISLCVLLFIARLFARLRRERYRSRVRRLRDELFDWMVENGQDFQSPEYRDVRQTLNGMMRLSNTLGPMEFLILLARDSRTSNDPQSRDIRLMADSSLKRKLIQVEVAAVHSLLWFLYAEGTFGTCCRAVWMCCRTWSYMSNTKAAVMAGAQHLLRDAHQFGSPHLTAAQRMLLTR